MSSCQPIYIHTTTVQTRTTFYDNFRRQVLSDQLNVKLQLSVKLSKHMYMNSALYSSVSVDIIDKNEVRMPMRKAINLTSQSLKYDDDKFTFD